MSAFDPMRTCFRTGIALNLSEEGRVQRSSCGAAAQIAHDDEWRVRQEALAGVATVLIIGASRGIGLGTVKAALEAGHSVRALAGAAGRIPVGRAHLPERGGG